MILTQTTPSRFRAALAAAQLDSERVRSATTPAVELTDFSAHARFYLTIDERSGYALDGGELRGLFSTVKGRGDAVMRHAVRMGANRLDCLDGFLTGFCARHGFAVDHREDNWVPGGPDVVCMVKVV